MLVKNGEMTCFAADDPVFNKVSYVVDGSVGLGDVSEIFFFGTQELEFLHVYFPILYPAIRRFDKAHRVDLRVYTKGRDQTHVRTFRSLSGTETAIVRIVYVTNL